MIHTVNNAIRGHYGIQRKGGALLLDKNIKVHINAKQSFGFSLDNPGHPPFPFFKDNPPKHLAKMCDAIIMFEHDDVLYFTLIEQKTGDAANYDKQLANGKFFCEWLVSLCKEHGYNLYGTVSYFGVLVWEPRPIPLKGGTTHALPIAYHHRLFDKFFDIQNETDIDVNQLVSSRLPPPKV